MESSTRQSERTAGSWRPNIDEPSKPILASSLGSKAKQWPEIIDLDNDLKGNDSVE